MEISPIILQYIWSIICLAGSQLVFKIIGNDIKYIPYKYNIDYIMLLSLLLAGGFICETINSYIKNGRNSRKSYYLQHCIYKIWINIISIYGILFAGVMTLSNVNSDKIAFKSYLTLLYAIFLIISIFVSISFNANIFHHVVSKVKSYNEKHAKYKRIVIHVPDTVAKTDSGKKLYIKKHKIFANVKIKK